MRIIFKIALIFALAAPPVLLGACGLKGELKTPPPIGSGDGSGDNAAANYNLQPTLQLASDR